MKKAFYSCPELTSVTIGSKVKEISLNAFSNCGKLSTVNLTKATGLQRIDDNAFMSCSTLTSIEIPSNVKIISEKSFMNTGITNVTYKGTTQPNFCAISAFEGSPVKTLNIPEDYKNKRFCGLQIKKTSKLI